MTLNISWLAGSADLEEDMDEDVFVPVEGVTDQPTMPLKWPANDESATNL